MNDLYQEITNEVISALEKGADEARLPWAALSMPVNASTGKHYRGINVLLFWLESERKGYTENTWATYRQWQNLGRTVRRGSKGTRIVFFKELTNDDDEESKPIFVARSFKVFNACQLEGYTLPETAEEIIYSESDADYLIHSSGAEIRFGGSRAYYHRLEDYIQIPVEEMFISTAHSSATENYYSTILHELIHWSGPKQRLDRDLSGRFGDSAYAMEELIAELGASFLCAELGVTNTIRPENVAYLANWLQVLKNDKRAIFTAASKASEAAAYLKSFQE